MRDASLACFGAFGAYSRLILPFFLGLSSAFPLPENVVEAFLSSSLLNEAKLGFSDSAIGDLFEPFGRCKSVLHTRAFVFFLAKVYCIVNMSIRRAIKRLLDSVEF